MSNNSFLAPAYDVRKLPLFMDSKYYFKGALRCPKTNPFMDSQNYLARVRTVPETCPFYGLRKPLFIMCKNPCHLVLNVRFCQVLNNKF